jgi:hypothetical protein
VQETNGIFRDSQELLEFFMASCGGYLD